MSKILIFSKNNDPSTNSVIDWILKEGKESLRINGESFLYENTFRALDEQLSLDVGAVWFRRTFDPIQLKMPFDLEHHYRKECGTIFTYTYYSILKNSNKGFQLNKYEDAGVNKLLVNKLAANCGLRTPKSYLVSNKKRLVELLAEFAGDIIFKPVSQIFAYYADKSVYVSYTEKVSEEGLKKLPDYFLPSYIQEYVESDFEVRVVYLCGDFFSMAIFSGGNDKTKTDFRNYDYANWNRMIPFDLPEGIKVKIAKLVTQMDLNFCSIDLLYSEGEYFFLEVNPVGQFGMVSLPCNFNIEKQIGKILCYEAKNNS